MRERHRRIAYEFIGSMGGEFAEWLWGCETDPESEKNLEDFSRHLAHGSGVVAINHINLWDGPLISVWLVNRLGGHGGNLKIIGGPGAKKHFDVKRNPVQGLFLKIGRPLGLEFFPVVQITDLRSYPRETRRAMLEEYRSRMRTILEQSGGVVMIAPEGTRSDNGQLQRGMGGVTDLANYSGETEIKFLPIGIVPKGEFNSGMRLGKIRLVVGEQFSTDELTRAGIPDRLDKIFRKKGVPPANHSDLVMLRIASTLPKEMRGVYGEYFDHE